MKEFKISTSAIGPQSKGIQAYLKSISKIPLLTPEQETEVAMKAMKGDEEAKEILIKSNLRFVVSVAKQYSSDARTVMDLINEGNIGLIEAAGKFDPTTGFKFISLAIWHIRKYIFQYLNKYSREVRIPDSQVVTITKLKEIRKKLEYKYDREVTDEEVIDYYADTKLDVDGSGTNKRYIREALKSVDGTSAIDRSNVPESEHVQSPIETINGDPDGSDHLIKKHNNVNLINSYLDSLRPLPKNVIIMIFGLNGQEPMAIKDIAEHFEVTQQTVHNWRDLGIRKIRRKMRVDGIDFNSFFNEDDD